MKTRIVFPEYKNEIIAAAIKEAGEKYEDLEAKTAESLEEACEMVKNGEADAMVAGIDYTSREVILSCRDIIGVRDKDEVKYDDETGRPLKKTFSASFVLTKGDEKYIVGDAAACKNPDLNMLYDIVVQTHETAEAILNDEPRIAMLSFSTLGSGGNDTSIDRIKRVIQKINDNYPDIKIDGELQLDAAINKTIGDKKAPGSTVAGRANVLIVPDLNAGNILYKAMEQFGGFTAAGPILQGFASPVSDLSRGSTKEDVLSVIDVEMKLVESRRGF